MSNQEPQDGRPPLPPVPGPPQGQGGPPRPPVPGPQTAERAAPQPAAPERPQRVAEPAPSPTAAPVPPLPARQAARPRPEEPCEPPGPLPQRPAGESKESTAALTDTAIRRLTSREFERELVEIDSMESQHEVDATPEAVVKKLSATSMSPRHQVEAWIAAMVKSKASDLILRADGRPSTRVDGRIGFLPGRVPGAGALLEVLQGVVGEKRMEEWQDTGSCDAALDLDGLGRFRLNAYKQMGEPAIVLRRVSEDPPDLSNLELPTASLQEIASRRRGLVLVTGVAGSGKSTTLAGMIEHMNRTMERHVVTLEDPVEVLFKERRCVISQREVGVDCNAFHDGLRHALRQSPDVILIGEMRDPVTVTAALDAAETGHLVMSTMHTVNAPQTLDRILGFFPAERHKQIKMRLADNLAAVLSQRLVPRAQGTGMVPACELLLSTPRIRELLEEGATGEIGRVIEAGEGEGGLISFNQSLFRLVQQKLIELKDALAASDRPDELILALRGITKGSDQKTKGKPAPQVKPDNPQNGQSGGLRMSRD